MRSPSLSFKTELGQSCPAGSREQPQNVRATTLALQRLCSSSSEPRGAALYLVTAFLGRADSFLLTVEEALKLVSIITYSKKQSLQVLGPENEGGP